MQTFKESQNHLNWEGSTKIPGSKIIWDVSVFFENQLFSAEVFVW